MVTVLGAGLLCGTALAVIVPEGVHALYEDILEGKNPTQMASFKITWIMVCYDVLRLLFRVFNLRLMEELGSSMTQSRHRNAKVPQG